MSKAYNDIIKVIEFKSEGNLDLALEMIDKIRRDLIATDNLEDPGVFNDYSNSVYVQSEIYEEKAEYLELSKFQYTEANRIKPLIKYDDRYANFYFNYKLTASLHYIKGNNKSFESKKISTQKLATLMFESRSTYFDNVEDKEYQKQSVVDTYFTTKLSLVNSMGTNSLEAIETKKARLNGLLGELNTRIHGYYDKRRSMQDLIKSHIESTDLLLASKTIEAGRYQTYLTNENKFKPYNNAKRDLAFFEQIYQKNLSLMSIGMYRSLITKQKKVLRQIENYGLEKTNTLKYNRFGFTIYRNLYSAYFILRDYENALTAINDAQKYYSKLPQAEKIKDSYISYNLDLANLYLSQNKYELALEYSLRLIEERKEISKFQNGVVANIYYRLTNYEKAVEWQLKNIKELEKDDLGANDIRLSVAYFQMATYYIANKQYDTAENYLNRVKYDVNNKSIGMLRANLYAERAILNLHKRRYKQADDNMVLFAQKFELPFFEFLLVLNEEERGLVYKNEKYNPDLLFNYLSQRNEYSNEIVSYGYNYALLAKQLLLNTTNAISSNATIRKIPELNEINSKWAKVKEELKKVDIVNKDSLMDLARVYEKEIITRGKKSIVESYMISKVDWISIKEKLEQNEAAIEFVSFVSKSIGNKENTKNYGAFILRKDTEYPVFVNLFNESQINAILDPIIGKNIRSDNKIEMIYGQNGNKLYTLIWKPLEDNLKGIKNVYFSPAGVLHNLAFSALPNDENKYLGEEYRLNQLTSTRELLSIQTSQVIKKSALFGDIVYEIGDEVIRNSDSSVTRNSDFIELEGARDEIEEIYSLLNLNNIGTIRYAKKFATEHNFFKAVSDKPSLLHIATHAFYLNPLRDEYFMTDMLGFAKFKADKDPMNRSGLALSGANYFWRNGNKLSSSAEDGILTANEISNLDMRGVKLVVLSACETGLGESADNEGVFGLQRGLKIAGANNILVSLWKVDDRITKEYMVNFYENLIKKGLSIKDAYLATQKTIKYKYPNPYHWAAFVLLK